jgi:hypothetical protein
MARKRKMTDEEAKAFLKSAGISFGRDYYELKMSDTGLIADAAKMAGYSYKGSMGRTTGYSYYLRLSRLP